MKEELIRFRFCVLTYLFYLIFFVNCRLDDLNGSCDTTSPKYLERSLLLSASGQSNNPCGGSLFSLNDVAAINNTLLPEISPSSGRFYVNQNVSIRNPNIDANICYTTNGSVPSCNESNCENGDLYKSTIPIQSSISVKAVSCKTGRPSSNIAISDFVHVTQYVYVTNFGSANVSILKLNPMDGSLLLSGIAPSNSNPTSIGFAKGLGFAYVTTNSSIVNQYHGDVNSGFLNSNGTIASGISSSNISIDPQNRFVYVMNGGGNNISLYTINQTNGTLTSNGVTSTAFNLTASTTDEQGYYLYAIDSTNNLVNQFTINQTSGTLSLTTTNTTGNTPRDIKIHPSGNFIYISNEIGQNVTCYQRNSTNGFLSSRIDVTIDVVPNLRGMAFEKNGKYAYIVGNLSNLIYRVSIDNGTGIISVLNSYAIGGTGVDSIAIDESGNFLITSNITSNNLSVFRINPADGTLTFIGTYSVGTQPAGITIAGF